MYPSVEELTTEIPEEHKELLDHTAFVIVRPDALAMGHEINLINEFAEHGLYVVGFKYQYVDERQMEELYRYTQHQMLENQMRPLWWMTREMYRISPTLLLLLGGHFNRGLFASCSEFVESLKGPSNPALTEPNHIRYRYRSLNVVLCTIHSSDDPKQMLRESRIFFSAEEFLACMEHVKTSLRGKIPSPHSFLTKAALRWYEKPRRTGTFFDILVKVKMRILGTLLDSPFGLDCDELQNLYSVMKDITSQNLSYVEESELIHPLLDQELRVLDRANGITENSFRSSIKSMALTIDQARLLVILKQFANYRHFEDVLFSDVREVIRRNLVVMDDWEALVLESSFIFHNIQLSGYHVK